MFLRTSLGLFLVLLGGVLSVPGIPGQGILTALIGLVLLDFPGKRRLEQKILSRPRLCVDRQPIARSLRTRAVRA